MKNADDFHYEKEAITCNHQFDTFHCQQRQMEHKEGHMKNMLYILKGLSWAEVMPNSKKINSLPSAIVELHLSEGIS